MNEVVPGLFVGDYSDAVDANFDGERLCVLEGDIRYPQMTHHIPILHVIPGGSFHASREALNRCASLISHRLGEGKKLLVHCMAGIERSPLTVVWWLVSTGRHSSLDAAYGHLKSVRPIVEDRRHWIEKEVD